MRGRGGVGCGPGEIGEASQLTAVEPLRVMLDEIVEAGALEGDQGVLVVALRYGDFFEFRLVRDEYSGQVVLPAGLCGQVAVHNRLRALQVCGQGRAGQAHRNQSQGQKKSLQY